MVAKDLTIVDLQTLSQQKDGSIKRSWRINSEVNLRRDADDDAFVGRLGISSHSADLESRASSAPPEADPAFFRNTDRFLRVFLIETLLEFDQFPDLENQAIGSNS